MIGFYDESKLKIFNFDGGYIMKNSVLAPYGALKFLPLATKVGSGGKPGKPSILAPYGALKFLPIATKVGDNGKIG
ncbi:hypothetical protein [Sulfitobacter sp. JB4-11]|uniref:hypothetical protein n=1 Tax=Sulfitobacter rhodophyticola TaxID=3238304 RepID=UPI003D81AFDB